MCRGDDLIKSPKDYSEAEYTETVLLPTLGQF